MPSRLSQRVAARYLSAMPTLSRAAQAVAKGLARVIKDADIPVEARRFTKNFRELQIEGNTGWVRPKRFDDVIFQSTSAMDYIGDDGFERRMDVEGAANEVLLKTGIIGRRAK